MEVWLDSGCSFYIIKEYSHHKWYVAAVDAGTSGSAQTERRCSIIGKNSSQTTKAAEKYIRKAIEMGADHAVFFRTGDIEFDPRTLLKCMFGCNTWGKGHTCPSRPGSLKPWEYEQIFRKYSWGIIIHSHSKKSPRMSHSQ